jgi:hypothetical protein
MLSFTINKISFKSDNKIKCLSKFNIKFNQIHTDNLIVLIKWITLLIFITTPLCKYFFNLYIALQTRIVFN